MITDDLIPPDVLENVQKARALNRDGWMLLVGKMSNFHRSCLHKARKQGEEQRAKMLEVGNKFEFKDRPLNELLLDDDFLGGKYWMTVYCLPDATLDFAISLLKEVPTLATTRAITHAH